MTDATPLPTLAPLGLGPVYRDIHIWLPQLFLETVRADQPIIRGRTFINCRFEGPAVILPLAGCSFSACNMGEAADDIRNLLLTPVGPQKVVGAIPFQDCVFENSAFFMVGFTGSPEFLRQFAEMVETPA